MLEYDHLDRVPDVDEGDVESKSWPNNLKLVDFKLASNRLIC